MSYTWAELLGDEVTAADEPEQTSFFARMRDSLAKSRQALTAELASAGFDASDDEAWERLEEALIRSDVGVPATAELVRRLEARGVTGASATRSSRRSRTSSGPPRRSRSTRGRA